MKKVEELTLKEVWDFLLFEENRIEKDENNNEERKMTLCILQMYVRTIRSYLETTGSFHSSLEDFLVKVGKHAYIPTVRGWVPCKVKMPPEKEESRTIYDSFTLAEVDVEIYMASDLVNVTVIDSKTEEIFVSYDYTVDGKWCNFGECYYFGKCYEVIAWRPLPKPYREEEE